MPDVRKGTIWFTNRSDAANFHASPRPYDFSSYHSNAFAISACAGGSNTTVQFTSSRQVFGQFAAGSFPVWGDCHATRPAAPIRSVLQGVWTGVTGKLAPQVFHQLQALKLDKMLNGLECGFHRSKSIKDGYF